MKPHSLHHLNRQQVGAYAEYYVKMHLTLHGLQVFSSEVDDRGIDFVAQYGRSRLLEIQVKSVRTAEYVFMQKSKFVLHESLYLALVLIRDVSVRQKAPYAGGGLVDRMGRWMSPSNQKDLLLCGVGV